MTSFISRLFGAGAPERKQSRTARLVARVGLGLPRALPYDGVELARHGFETNPIVHRAVRMVAEAVGSVPWLIYEGRRELSEHPLTQLIARPNPLDTGAAFLETLVANLLIFGNAYVEAVMVDGVPREFHALRPDRMVLNQSGSGWPQGYAYTVGGDTVTFQIPQQGIAPILHLKFYHPLDDHQGLAPLRSAQTALDIHNACADWNRALLANDARPSGALVYAGSEGSGLSDEQFTRLREELEQSFSGFGNAGRPLLLEGGLEWRSFSLSPRDMDHAQTKAAAARDIALALGVPPMVLGLPGDNTYSNFQEANRAFWRQTVIPLVMRLQQNFGNWLSPAYAGITLRCDLDHIDALASERETEWRRIGSADFLSTDEKREAVGYGPRRA
ncbi:MAG: phage portal protein [Frankiales bacterium]|nr:phage portal protein [Frankiales bacterium]